jgi:hypothetical protein
MTVATNVQLFRLSVDVGDRQAMHTKYWDAARWKTEKICVDSINVQFRKIKQDTESGKRYRIVSKNYVSNWTFKSCCHRLNGVLGSTVLRTTCHGRVRIKYSKYLVRMDNTTKLLTDYFPMCQFYDAPRTVTTSDAAHVHTCKGPKLIVTNVRSFQTTESCRLYVPASEEIPLQGNSSYVMWLRKK